MITAAALCPAAPLMAAELTGDDPDAAEVRARSQDAAAWLAASGAEVVAIVAADPVTGGGTREWPATGRPDLAPFGGPKLVDAPRVPLGAGLGGRLLDAVGYRGDRRVWTVGPPEPDDVPTVTFAVPLTVTLAEVADRVALLVLADGSAHRNLKTSTDLARRAERFDAAVERSIVDGDLSALLALDPDDLMATGFPALRVLAAALPDPASTSMLYCAAPFGVGYFVATFTRRT